MAGRCPARGRGTGDRRAGPVEVSRGAPRTAPGSATGPLALAGPDRDRCGGARHRGGPPVWRAPGRLTDHHDAAACRRWPGRSGPDAVARARPPGPHPTRRPVSANPAACRPGRRSGTRPRGERARRQRVDGAPRHTSPDGVLRARLVLGRRDPGHAMALRPGTPDHTGHLEPDRHERWHCSPVVAG